MARFSSWIVALRRFCLTTNSWTPASSQACTIACPSDQRVAIGFSVTTWRPACADSIVWEACSPLGVARMMASALEPASSSVSDRKPGAPVPAVARASAAGSVSQTATSSALWAVLRDCLDVLAGNAAAADKGKADLAVGDRIARSWHERREVEGDRILADGRSLRHAAPEHLDAVVSQPVDFGGRQPDPEFEAKPRNPAAPSLRRLDRAPPSGRRRSAAAAATPAGAAPAPARGAHCAGWSGRRSASWSSGSPRERWRTHAGRTPSHRAGGPPC